MRKLLEFKCPVCGEYHEKLVRDPVEEAPLCTQGHGKTEKIMSSSTFHFANGAGTSMGAAYAFRNRPLWGG